MNLESKRKIATVLMGWEQSEKEMCWITPDGNYEFKSHFNPDTDPAQFLEVWNKLGETLRYRLGGMLRHKYDDFARLLDGPEIEMTTWILNNPAKVMAAIEEII